MTDRDTLRRKAAQSLTPEQYKIAFEHGTERAFTGPWLDEKRPGVYRCSVCGEALWDAADKYDSGSGWPSFTRPHAPAAIGTHVDASHGMVRTEVHCAACGAHMGHVFPDGPGPEGLRYCINGAVLDFTPDAEESK